MSEWQYHDGIKYRIIKKADSPFMKSINVFVGLFNNRFMTNYTTTIGKTIYTAHNGMTAITLEHELIHVKQWNKWWILFSLSYLLFPLPSLFTMRGYWERQAYEVNIREMHESWGDHEDYMDAFREHIIKQFTSSSYLWMDLRENYLNKWFDNVIKEIENE